MARIWAFLISLAPLQTFAGRGVEIETAEATPIKAAIASATTVRIQLEQRAIAWREIVALRFAGKTRPVAGSFLLLSDGALLYGKPVGFKDEAITWRVATGKQTARLTVPLEVVRAMVFSQPGIRGSKERRSFLREIFSTAPKSDQFLTTADDRIAGEFSELAGDVVVLKTAGGNTRLPISRLRAVIFNAELLVEQPVKGLHWWIEFADGTRFRAPEISITDNQLTAKPTFGGEIKTALGAVYEIRVVGGVAESLTERKPSLWKHTPYVDNGLQWRKNLTIRGGPMMRSGRVIPRGIGSTSRSEMTFDVESDDREFRASVALDDTSPKRSGAIFRVLVDGKERFASKVVSPGDNAIPIAGIKLQDAKQLTLVVEYGPFGDIGDYANWIEPIIIRDHITEK